MAFAATGGYVPSLWAAMKYDRKGVLDLFHLRAKDSRRGRRRATRQDQLFWLTRLRIEARHSMGDMPVALRK